MLLMLIVSALREIGEGKITQKDKQKININLNQNK
jgi:hypothetical protein